MLPRTHLAAVVALVASIPLVPLGLWLYATGSSPDRGEALAKNRRLAASLPRPAGTRLAEGQTFPLYRWGVEGSLVPVEAYRTAFLARLPHAMRPDAIVTYYVRRLHGWRLRLEAVDCAVLGMHSGCGAAAGTFTRGGVRIEVSVAETLRRRQSATEYDVYVSQ